MYRSQRKREVARAFWLAMPLPRDARPLSPTDYEALLKTLGVDTQQDMDILSSVIGDAIMRARRAHLPTDALDALYGWLRRKRLGLGNGAVQKFVSLL